MAVVPPQLDPPAALSGFGGQSGAAHRLEAVLRGRGARPGGVHAGRAGVDAGALRRHARRRGSARCRAFPGLQLRVEAGGYRGKPVYFLRVAPWTHAHAACRAPIAERARVSWSSAIATLTVFSHLRGGGADRAAQPAQGTRRPARRVPAGGVRLDRRRSASGSSTRKHVADPALEMGRFFIGQPLWAAGLLWLLYLALEPYVRRFWPATLVSWSRLMARQWRDPLVGRDDPVRRRARRRSSRASTSAAACSPQTLGTPAPPRTPALDDLLGTRLRAGAGRQPGVQRHPERALRGVRNGPAEDRRPARVGGVDGGDRALQLHQRARARPASQAGRSAWRRWC